MKDKDLDRIKGLYMQRFKSIIMTIAVMIYGYGYHLFPDGDYNKDAALIGILNNMFNNSGLSYLLFDSKTMKLFKIKITSLNATHICFNDEDDDDDFIINTNCDIAADAEFMLCEEHGIDDETFKVVAYLHNVTSEEFSKGNYYFKEIVPGTNPKLYQPCEDLTPFDFVSMVNMINFMDFVAFGISALHRITPNSCILDDNRVVISREQLISINIFLQDIARKISIVDAIHYKNNINLVYAVPFIDYSDVAIDDYAKKSLIGKRKVKLSKHDYVISEVGIEVTYPKLAVLSYQNS